MVALGRPVRLGNAQAVRPQLGGDERALFIRPRAAIMAAIGCIFSHQRAMRPAFEGSRDFAPGKPQAPEFIRSPITLRENASERPMEHDRLRLARLSDRLLLPAKPRTAIRST